MFSLRAVAADGLKHLVEVRNFDASPQQEFLKVSSASRQKTCFQ